MDAVEFRTLLEELEGCGTASFFKKQLLLALDIVCGDAEIDVDTEEITRKIAEFIENE